MWPLKLCPEPGISLHSVIPPWTLLVVTAATDRCSSFASPGIFSKSASRTMRTRTVKPETIRACMLEKYGLRCSYSKSRSRRIASSMVSRQAKKSGFSDLSTPRKSSQAYSRSSPALFFFHIMSTVSYLIFYKFWSIMCSPLCYPILTLL